MKQLIYIGFAGVLIFELLHVYLIMPMPGSQRFNSIDIAYFLHQWRWTFRILFIVVLLVGLWGTRIKTKWLALSLVILAAIVYVLNFQMAADHMFYQPKTLSMAQANDNEVDAGRLVIGIVNNGEAKAYPIRFLGYHHQVQDKIGGKPVIVTYCTVCRTGRVFEPLVNGQPATFRLVGMDHFNAMFEDVATKSWWRQATGEAIAGTMRGSRLPEFFSVQTSLATWLQLNPNSLVMQADSSFITSYDTTFKYEDGKSKSKLTGTDSLPGKPKSWVVWVKSGKESRSYAWDELKQKRIIRDTLNHGLIMVVLAEDNKGFFAFEDPAGRSQASLQNDTLYFMDHRFRLNGQGIDTVFSLKALPAYQEFLHSWQSFNPGGSSK